MYIFVEVHTMGKNRNQKGSRGQPNRKKNSPMGKQSKSNKKKRAGFHCKVGEQVLFLKEGELLVGIVESKLPGNVREWVVRSWKKNLQTNERDRCNIRACERPVCVSDLIPSVHDMERGKSVLIAWSDEQGKFMEMAHATILAPLDQNIWLVKPKSHHAIRVHTTEIIECPEQFKCNTDDEEILPDKQSVENINLLNLYVDSCVELLDNLLLVRHTSKVKIQSSEINEKEKNERIKQLEDLFHEAKQEIENLRSKLFKVQYNYSAELRELKSMVDSQKAMLYRYQKEILCKNKEILSLREKNLKLSQRLQTAERECAILKQQTYLEKRPGPEGKSDGFFHYRPAGSTGRPRLAVDITTPEMSSAEASAKVLSRRADELNKVGHNFLFFFFFFLIIIIIIILY